MQDMTETTQQETRNIFNPNEHLIQLKSKAGSQDYLPVKWRLVWFRSIYPHGTIDTQEMMIDLDRIVETEAFVWNAEKRRSEKVIKQAKGYARFKAIVTDGKGGRATGTKSENAANFADYIEKSETGAIGRALAALGFGTQFTDQEFEEGERIVDAPVERVQNGHQNSQQAAPAPSAIDPLRTRWGKAYAIPDEQIEARWPRYLQHLLKLSEPDLRLPHLMVIERDLQVQEAKLSKAS